MRSIGLKPMSLGLDLRGGVHFVYEVDVQGAVAQSLERMEREHAHTLRDKRIPYGAVTRDNDVVRVTLRNAGGSEARRWTRLKRAGRQHPADHIEQSAEGPVIEMRMTPAEIKQRQDFAIQQNITTLRNRVDELGISEPIVTRQAANRIVVQLPGVQDPNEAIRVLGATATLEFRLVDETNNPYEAEQTKRVPIGSKLLQDARRPPDPAQARHHRDRRAALRCDFGLLRRPAAGQRSARCARRPVDARSDAATTSASAWRSCISRRSSSPKASAAKACATADRAPKKKSSAPRPSRACCRRSFHITGLQATEARELALLLRSGALAAPQTIVEQRSVGPSLGQDNIDRGIARHGASACC